MDIATGIGIERHAVQEMVKNLGHVKKFVTTGYLAMNVSEEKFFQLTERCPVEAYDFIHRITGKGKDKYSPYNRPLRPRG